MSEMAEVFEAIQQGGVATVTPTEIPKTIFIGYKDGRVEIGSQKAIVNHYLAGKHEKLSYYREEKKYTSMDTLTSDFQQLGENEDYIFIINLSIYHGKQLKTPEDVNSINLETNGERFIDDVALLKKIDCAKAYEVVQENAEFLKNYVNYVSPTEKSVIVQLDVVNKEIYNVEGRHINSVLGDYGYKPVDGIDIHVYDEEQLLITEPTPFSDVPLTDVPMMVLYGFKEADEESNYIEWEEPVFGNRETVEATMNSKGFASEAMVCGLFSLASKNRKLDPKAYDFDKVQNIVNQAIALLQ